MRTLFFIALAAFVVSCKKAPKNTALSGQVFGTSYSVIYDTETDFTQQFDSLFYVINKSMSTYQVNSDISRVNRNETLKVDAHFIEVFQAAKAIYRATEGAFDPTIGAVVNAWDFGPGGKIQQLDSLKIDSLMASVGFNKMGLVNGEVKKRNGAFIDFNAIAKGYGVDVVANFLERKQVANYLVEIGGEIRTKGLNVEKETPWRVGVEMPHFDGSQSILRSIDLTDAAMATS